MKDRKADIKNLENMLSADEQTHKDLHLELHNLEGDLHEARKNVDGLERAITTKHEDIRLLTRKLGNGRVQLQSLQQEDRLYERQAKIESIKSEHPSFIDLLSDYLNDLQKKQEAGKKLPLEVPINAESFIKKIELFDTNEYITTYGMDKVFVLYQNYAETYDKRIEDLITGHLDGIPSQLYSYEDFIPMARSFIKDNNVIGYLGR